MEQGKCEDKGCEWLITDDPDDCVITTTSTSTPSTTSEEVGCCKGEDAKSNEMCNQKTDRKSCDRSSSCTFIVDGTIEKECRFDEEKEPGCCHGDLTSYKANDKCVGIDNQNSCERKSCTWLITEDPEDCVVTTTTSTPRTTEIGCCAGTSAKNTAMCNEKVGRESCERSGKCEFRVHEVDCSWPTTTSEPWLGAKMGAKQRRGKSAASHKQESMLFGGEGVISETMQSTVSLSTLMMFVIAAFAAFQLFKWWSARKAGGYTKVADIAPTTAYQNSCQSV